LGGGLPRSDRQLTGAGGDGRGGDEAGSGGPGGAGAGGDEADGDEADGDGTGPGSGQAVTGPGGWAAAASARLSGLTAGKVRIAGLASASTTCRPPGAA
jgi:hypothetical protein